MVCGGVEVFANTHRLLVKEGVVELCFKSLLRQRLDRHTVFRQTEDPITPVLLGKAMTTLCKYGNSNNYLIMV